MDVVRSGWIYVLGLVAIMGGYATYVLRPGVEHAGERGASQASPSARHSQNAPRRMTTVAPMSSTRRAALRGDVPNGERELVPGSSGVQARERRISELDVFRTFAEQTHLSDEQRRKCAHILALYYENQDALIATSSDDDALSSMKLQLLGDTVAQLRSRMPDAAAWDAFVKSGLLIGIAPVAPGPS